MSPDLVAIAHAFPTVALVGLIWFVQVVHYPLFALVGERDYARYAAAHVRRTTWVVAPLMLTEFGCAVALALSPPAPELAWLTTTGFVLLVVVWVSTALLQVPCHRRLERELDREVVARLVATNWIRTLAWTARGVIALVIVLLVDR